MKWRDWTCEPLGVETDAAIARRIGCPTVTVLQARKRRGIPPAHPRGRTWTTIEDARLGVMPDAELAEFMGIDVRTVARRRIALKIESYGNRKRREKK